MNFKKGSFWGNFIGIKILFLLVKQSKQVFANTSYSRCCASNKTSYFAPQNSELKLVREVSNPNRRNWNSFGEQIK